MLKTRRTLPTLVAAALIAGCTSVPAAVGPTTATKTEKPAAQAGGGDISVSTGGEIVEKDEAIELTQDGSQARKLQQAAATAFPYDIRYVSQVPPVTVDGAKVQANDILLCGCDSGAAFIAYNTAGDKFAGAIQIINTTDKARPTITREIKFGSMDVNALYRDGDYLYFGGQADPDKWGFKSYIGRVNLNNPSGTDISASLKAMPSHAVTSITKLDGKFYVGTGAAGGGVQVLNAQLEKVSFTALPDVRSLDVSGYGVVALGGTQDTSQASGKIVTLGKAMDIGLPNFDVQGVRAKATLEVNAQVANLHVAMSTVGYQVFNPVSKNILFKLPNPSTNPQEVTNGVSTDGNLAFVANGEYGFRVVQIKDHLKRDAEFGALAGYHQMKGTAYDNKSYSANFLRYRANHLFVASGLGGVNIYNLTAK